MALVKSLSLSSTLPTWIQSTNPRAAFSSPNSKPRNQKAQSINKNNRFRHLFGIVRKDVEYLKKKVDVGVEWANVAFQIPKVSKTLDHFVWLRNLERHDTYSVDPPRFPPQPLYPELTGVDLLMADLKALVAYISYVYYLSKGWSRPLPELYDPQDIAQYFNYRPHIVAIRLIEVFFSFTSAAIKIRISKFNNINEDINSSDYFFGMMLKETMLSLGPVFIKVGQSLSTRPDIIGTEMSKALSELHDQIPPFPRTEAMTIIEEELGSPVESNFTYISEEPVAAASFGQVYRGTTLDGFSVAVKVQRPNLRHVVVRDVHILRLGLGLFQKIAKRSDLRLYADELGKGFLGELDYNLEASNASEFMEAHSHFSFICVPNIYPQLTRKRVLTMEWIDGESPNELLKVCSGNLMHGSKYSERQQYEARRRLLDLVNKGVEACLVQLLETGILHADPHPGNLRYTSSGQMGFLDFGLICRMEKKHQFAMLASIVHIVNGDWTFLVQALAEMDVVRPGDNIRRITMDLEDALGEVQYKDGTPDVKFSRVLGNIWSVAFKYHLRMPPYYTLVLRSLASFEGLAVATDPNFKTFEAAFPYVVQKLLTDSSVGTRKLLHSVVLNKRKEFRWEKLGLFLRSCATRKSLHYVVASNSEISLNNSTNEEAKRVFDVANLVLKLLPSKDGAVLRRLLMTADGASLVRAMVSEQGSCFRQQFSRDMAHYLYQWTSQALGLDIVKSKKINDYETILKDRRLKVIFTKVLESARRDRVLMVRLCWASFVMFVTASALACHRVLVSLSEVYITSFSFAPKRFAITT